MRIRTVATVVFHDSQNNILLQDRHGISKFGEEWGFFGGSIEQDETPSQAIVREIKEELNFDLKEFEFFKKYHEIRAPDWDVTAYTHLAPLPPVSQFRQTEGVGMKVIPIQDRNQYKLLPIDYKILTDIEEHLKSRIRPK